MTVRRDRWKRHGVHILCSLQRQTLAKTSILNTATRHTHAHAHALSHTLTHPRRVCTHNSASSLPLSLLCMFCHIHMHAVRKKTSISNAAFICRIFYWQTQCVFGSREADDWRACGERSAGVCASTQRETTLMCALWWISVEWLVEWVVKRKHKLAAYFCFVHCTSYRF